MIKKILFLTLFLAITFQPAASASDIASITPIPISLPAGRIDIIGVAPSTDSAIAISSKTKNLYVIDLPSRSLQSTIGLPSTPTGLAIDEDNKTAIISTPGKLLYVNMQTGAITEAALPEALANSRIAGIWQGRYLIIQGNIITQLDPQTLQEHTTTKAPGNITKTALYNDTIYILTDSPALYRANLTTGLIEAQTISTQSTSDIVIDKANGMVIAISPDKLTEYDLNLQPANQMPTQQPVTDLAADPLSGALIATNEKNNTFSIYETAETATPKQVPFLESPSEIAIDPANNQALVAYKDGVALVTFVNPVPIAAQIAPASTTAGNPDLLLSITGSMFLRSSTAFFDTQALNTNFKSTDSLTAEIPYRNLTLPGQVPITVYNPPPGGGQSNNLIFKIFNPVPKIEKVSPTTLQITGSEATLRITGKDFLPNAYVTLDGRSLPTKFLSSILLEATASLADIKTPALYPLTVTNPTPTQLTSNTAFVSIEDEETPNPTSTEKAQPTEQRTAMDAGQTGTLTGCIVDTYSHPIQNVTIKTKGITTQTGADGCFTLPSIPAGRRVVLIDGNSASDQQNHYPTIPLTIDIAPNITTSMPFQVYLHHQKDRNFKDITNSEDTILTDQELPGVKMTIPKGVRITGWDGQPNRKVSVRTVPTDRLPVKPLPDIVNTKTVYMFYFDKVGGGIADEPVPFRAPNNLGLLPGEQAILWYYDESPNEGEAPNDWAVAGTGTVTPDGQFIETDPGVGIPKFCCGAIAWAITAITNIFTSKDCSSKIADPVDVTTGHFMHVKTDLVVQGAIPVSITRYHKSGDTNVGVFGKGSYFEYDWWVGEYADMMLLIKPGNYQYAFPKQTDGTYKNILDPSAAGDVIVKNANSTKTLTTRDKWVYTFAVNGNLTAVTDPNGNHLTIARRSDYEGGYITQITNHEGKIITFQEQHISGRIFYATSVTVSDGRSVSYTYEPDPTAYVRLKTVTYSDGSTIQYQYDTSNRITSITNQSGAVEVANIYDSGNRVTQQTHADGGNYTFNYTIAGGNVTQTSLTEPGGAVTTWQFNSYQYITSKTTPDGTTTYDLDPETNRLMSITDPLGRQVTYTYNPDGQIATYTDNTQHTTYYDYDPATNKVSHITDPLDNITSATYYSNGNIHTVTDPTGQTTTIAYNGAGKPTTITDNLGHNTTAAYDSMNNLTSITDALGNSTAIAYDNRGNTMSVRDAMQNTTFYAYNNMDRPATIADHLGRLTKIAYGPSGKITQVTDAKNHLITYDYDNRDRVSKITDQAGNYETYTYNTSDKVLTHTDRKGQTTTYAYNQMGKLTNTTYADQSTTDYSYDTIGRLSTITDSLSGTISYTYTDTGCSSGCTAIPDRIAQVNTPNGNISYGYDILGRRTSMTVQGQPTVNYEYDDAGRLTNINTLINTQPAAFDIAYDNLGRRSTVAFPNGVISSYGYDNVSDLLTLQHTALGNTILESLAYTYNAIGNRTTMDRPGVTLPLPQAKADITHNSLNQMLTVNDKTITYDLNGNMTTVTNTCGTTTYTWDARNQLAGISGYNTDCSVLTASFQYDALGRRTSKTINGTTTQYLYDGLDIVQELQNGTVTANYIRTLNIDEPLARIQANGSVRYYQTDPLGSVIALTDETGAVRTQYAYDPFGGVVVTGEASDNPFQYTGRENDSTGLYYYRARYYDPGMQGFVSEDPIGLEEGINQFVYVNANPLNLRDPLGLWTISIGLNLSGYLAVIGGGGGTAINIGYSQNKGWSTSLTGTVGAGAATGLGASLGVSIIGTNASSVDQLLGSFVETTRGLGAPITAIGITGINVKGGGVIIGIPNIFKLLLPPKAGAIITTTSALIQYANGYLSIGDTGNSSIWRSHKCK